ncbi:glycoside hydrolase family 108 protein [Bradyrhizobium sp. Cp5.3]|uniref:glycoside hydrolase family 108 protein n=1 Tax=Bradyrhizobium sp. Cp5.3 TaxID=443598 RepID=UPI00041DC8C9|nr:glycosyl hydrolase 108 family protein [Bradyrhizobium sp. Cp5.3]
MAIANFAACLAVTLAHEGGYSNNRNDRGNWTGGNVGVGVLKGTNYGIAAHAYPYLDIKNLTLGDAKELYERDYWKPVWAESLPYGVDLATFDAGVMSGPRQGVLWLQAAVGAKEDGVAGNETISKALAANSKATIQKICAKRRTFVQSLSSWKVFGKGWSRRIAEVEAKAVAMWLTCGTGKLTEDGRAEMMKDSTAAQDKAVAQDTSAKCAGGVGVGVCVGDTILNRGLNWIVIGVGVLLVIAAIVLWIDSRHNKERVVAYTDVAAC